MKKTYIDHTAFRYKLACDGIDLISKPLGSSVIGSYGRKYIEKHCKLKLSKDQLESFIRDCIRDRKFAIDLDYRGLSQELCDKYEIGLFVVSKQHCIQDVDFVLFNEEQLNFWRAAGINLFDLQFMVVPSRDWAGEVNEVGFRILDMKQVHDGFKWLFPIGQQATFGLHKCSKDKKLVLCEGFLDYVAFVESGYTNIVGIGSVEVTDNHLKQLKTDNWSVCFDMDRFGFFNSSKFIDQRRACFYFPQGKDPYEVYRLHGRVDLLHIS